MTETKRPSLMQIAAEKAELIQTIQEAGGEITEEQLVQLESNSESLSHKLANYLAVIDRMDADEAQAKEEVKIAYAFAASCAKASQSLKLRMAYALKLADTEKCKAGFRSVSISKGKPSLVIENEALVPERYKTTTTPQPVTSIDKTKLKAFLLGDETTAITGASLQYGPDTVRIYKPKKEQE